jgi:hypothetical protein
MATVEIPIPSVVNVTGSAIFRVRLDGQDYVMTLQWNQRARSWTLDVKDVDSSLIVAGVKLVPFWPLLRLVTDERKPPGTLMLWNPDGGQAYPTLTGLGTTSKLVYYEAAE